MEGATKTLRRVLGCGVLRLVGEVYCKDYRKQRLRQTALQVASMLRWEAGVWGRLMGNAHGVVDGQQRCA